MTKKILEVLNGKTLSQTPIWLMRQAGRFLPEYRQTREKAGSFLDLCYNPELAFEVTMQPIRRFGFDAAILFSDILVVPHALGRNLRFKEKKGPILDPLSINDIKKLNVERAQEKLSPSFETLALLKKALPSETALIGFCGAPWTVATYMIAGHGTADQAPARIFGFSCPEAMRSLLDILADVSADYLINQVKAGADVLQIFDSWAGILDEKSFDEYVIHPIQRMVQRIRKVFPKVPIIGFPKGAGALYQHFSQNTGVTALSLDWSLPMSFAQSLQKVTPIQGNLDPLRLVVGGQALENGVKNIMDNLSNGPLIFNLGHGITPQTPIENVEKLIKLVRNFNK
ncbi:uroporphyrinogen decarboxylase [uncultured Bartonella sp.]|uniref:uroporphyrinogen decarboxylase n=1 Tax=uncultured Bartonella sp. TaxID=104108 RepID=UPI0026224772|nr:uroporphyrinogen decarboxylase [uncultured Bartonella sp.]